MIYLEIIQTNSDITVPDFLRELKLNQKDFIFKLVSIIEYKESTIEIKANGRNAMEMDYFKIGKHQVVEENLLYTTKILYELLETEQHIDELFLLYAKRQNVLLNLNIERILYLALTFLFSFEKILVDGNMIKRSNI